MGKARKNQKLKILYLYQIFTEKTDATHSITVKEIIEELDRRDVSAERKSLYDDIEQLRRFGADIVKEQTNKTCHYRLNSRQFSLPELKLLVDSVQSSKFITEEKSKELIKKIEKCASDYEASQLSRQVFVNGRIKSMNESIFDNVDMIHQAIAGNLKVEFHYFQWNIKKETELRRQGELYKVSPWGLSWTDDNYYLIAYDDEAGIIKHYRVDKMLDISISDERREGKDVYANTNIAEYTKKHFAMFDGEEKRVSLRCKNHMIGILIDRFGTDVPILKDDDEHFIAKVKVALSSHFIGWVFALGEDIEIVGPDSVLEIVNNHIDRLVKQYRR